VKYLSGLFDRRLDSILAAYNAGEGTVLAYLNGRTLLANGKEINPTGIRTAGGIPPYRETTTYVVNGKKIYDWLLAQGKFQRKGRDEQFPTAALIASPENMPSDRTTFAGPDTIIVFYDPRNGARYVVNDRGTLSPIHHNGPVIISPQVRSVPTQKARSTFAGLPP
jgi:hypothetical protein